MRFRSLVLLVIAGTFACVVASTAGNAKERLIGDLDGNGTVNLDDFFIFASHFGTMGGAIFEAGSVDTLIVDRVVEVPVPVVVRDTVYRGSPKLKPSITVEPGGWSQPVELVQAICKQVQDILSEPLIFALDSDIVVRHKEPEGPRLLYSRTPNGSYVIWLDTERMRIAQNIFQFAHEYGHVMSNYYQTLILHNQWFNESLSSMASLYALRKMDEKIQGGYWLNVYVDNASIPRCLHALMRQLLVYARQNIPGQRMETAQFRTWFEVKHAQLTQSPTIGDTMI